MLHTDRWAGAALEPPEGWSVEYRKGNLTVRREPSGFAAAAVYRLRAPPGASAESLARHFVGLARASDPTFQALRAPAPDAGGGLAFRSTGTWLGRRVEARFRVTVQDGAGTVAGFQAPAEELAALAPTLASVLGSIRPVPAIARTPYVDPAERAFTILVPEGFQARGGTVRLPQANGLPQTAFEAVDASGSLRAAILPDAFQFSDASPAGALGALFGMGGLGALGLGGAPPLPFRPASEFAAGWLVPRARPGARIEAADERPDLVVATLPELAKRGLLGQVDTSIAIVTLSLGGAGGARRERILVTVSRLRAYGQWTAYLSASVSAPVGRWSEWEPVLTGIIDSLEENPQWRAAQDGQMNAFLLQQQQQRHARLQDVSRTLSQTSDIVAQGWTARQATYDHVFHDWSNATLGRQDMKDASGQVWNVPSGHEQYWRDDVGQVHAGGWLAQPDPTWHRLDPLG